MRVIFFIDAGYLRGMAARVQGSADATNVELSPAALRNWAMQKCVHLGSFVRIYVYDARFEDGHPRREDHESHLDAMNDVPGVRVRTGTLVDRGRKGLQQKGVDTLLVLDVLQMAQLGAYDIAVLLAGDADFAEVVDAVQRLGRQVWVVRGDGFSDGLSKVLRQYADDYLWMTPGDVNQLAPARTVPTN